MKYGPRHCSSCESSAASTARQAQPGSFRPRGGRRGERGAHPDRIAGHHRRSARPRDRGRKGACQVGGSLRGAAALPGPEGSAMTQALPSVEAVQQILDPLFPGLMGVRIVALEAERVAGELVVRPDLCTTGGTLHGGAYMAFADTLGAVGTFINMPQGKRTTTTDSSTKFIGAARANTHDHGRMPRAAPRADHHGVADDDPLRRRQAVRRRHADAAGHGRLGDRDAHADLHRRRLRAPGCMPGRRRLLSGSLADAMRRRPSLSSRSGS